MLKSLEVKDYALIEHINIEFGRGLNIITGETGTGKSILIDAMGLLLGERASTEVVRKGADKSIVESLFEVKGNAKVKTILEQNDIDFYPDMIVRREVSLKGSNRCFINDTPVSLSVIKDIGDLLVDLHGQHEHQSLLRKETHIDYLDDFGDYNNLLLKYREYYFKLIETEKELETLKEQEQILKEKKEINSFQLKEINTVSPEVGEEEKLIDELKILENSEKLDGLSTGIYDLLYDSEKSVYDSLVQINNDLNKLREIDKSFNESFSEIETALTLIKDISEFVRSYKSKIDIDPGNIESVRERIGAINLLKKKYGGSVKSVLERRSKLEEELELTENYSNKISELNKKLMNLGKETGSVAKSISKKRKEKAKEVKTEVENYLMQLGIPNPKFKTEIIIETAENDSSVVVDGKPSKHNSKGIDRVEFYLSTNPGEDPKPLAKIASGGEISRVMLSLKSTLAKSDRLPLLIFDEIDVGVSGRIAQRVGGALKSLAKYHQIIAITHLPQIAGLADQHYSVSKITEEGRTVSSIKKLTDKERIKEIAKLISGEKITEASIRGAQELMGIKANIN